MAEHAPGIVIPAAGASSRVRAALGHPKALVPVDDRRWLEVQLDALPATLGDIVVVLGHELELHRQSLPPLAAAERDWTGWRGRRVRVAVNPAPERGSFSSLCTGLAAHLAHAPGAPVFLLPVDVPAPGAAVWRALEGALVAEAAVPEHGGRGGHPVLLSSGFAAALLAHEDDPGARLDEALRRARAAGRVARVTVDDPRVRSNLNTPEAWEAHLHGLRLEATRQR